MLRKTRSYRNHKNAPVAEQYLEPWKSYGFLPVGLSR
ncbi:Uncharacterised protein [Vibrio cholerae]|nr:Uncharacterised protein [Vibrio cholerae]